MTHPVRRALSGGLVVLVVPAVAFAAVAPKKNVHFDQRTSKQTFIDFDTSKDGKSLKYFSSYRECNPVPFRTPPKISVKAGKFSFNGKLVDVTGKAQTLVLKGQFVSATKATGTVQISNSGCAGKVHKFTATYDSKTAPGQAG